MYDYFLNPIFYHLEMNRTTGASVTIPMAKKVPMMTEHRHKRKVSTSKKPRGRHMRAAKKKGTK